MLYVHRDMDVRSLLRRPLRSALLALVILASSTSVAAATPNAIEAVWSFDGGAVAIKGLSNGTFQGTVVTPTRFSECEHPAGEVMWTDIRPQTDGSFWGFHQWYREGTCEDIPVLGLTAWRVLETPSGAHVLKACFNTPGGETQPAIAANGKEEDVTYGCKESSPLAPLPKVSEEGTGKGNEEGSGKTGEGTGPGGNSSGEGSNGKSAGSADSGLITFSQTVLLPNVIKACFSQTSLKIKLRNPKYDPLTEVVVKINGKSVADVKGIKVLKKGITLKKLPIGSYKISIVATTVLKQHLSGSQSYKSCTTGSGNIGLERVKKKHHHHA